MQLEVTPIPPEHLQDFWPLAGKWLARADVRNGGYFCTEDYRDGILAGYYRLYHLKRGKGYGWLVLSLGSSRSLRYLTVDVLAGNGLLSSLKSIEAFCREVARKEQCRSLFCIGRRGWGKMLEPLGWKEVQRVYAVDLETFDREKQ